MTDVYCLNPAFLNCIILCSWKQKKNNFQHQYASANVFFTSQLNSRRHGHCKEFDVVFLVQIYGRFHTTFTSSIFLSSHSISRTGWLEIWWWCFTCIIEVWSAWIRYSSSRQWSFLSFALTVFPLVLFVFVVFFCFVCLFCLFFAKTFIMLSSILVVSS